MVSFSAWRISRNPCFPSLAVGPGRPAPGLKPLQAGDFPCAFRAFLARQISCLERCSTHVAPLTGSDPAQAVLSVRRRREQRVPGRQPRKRKGDPHGKCTRIRHGNQSRFRRHPRNDEPVSCDPHREERGKKPATASRTTASSPERPRPRSAAAGCAKRSNRAANTSRSRSQTPKSAPARSSRTSRRSKARRAVM